MSLTDSQREFLERNHSAAMITIADDGMPKAVRVGVTLVGDRLWSSGTSDRVRTRRLHDDPRCVMFVFGKGYEALTVEGRVHLIEGPTRVDDSVTLFRTMEGRPDGPLLWYGREVDEEELRRILEDEGRIVYDLEIDEAYGLA